MVSSRRLRRLLVVVGLTLAIGAGAVLVASAAHAASPARAPAQASDIDDNSTTRRVQLLAGGLAILGVALVGVTVWFWKSTRPDPEPLAPLELMGTRRWRRADPIERRHQLDEVRAHLNDKAAEEARLTVDPSAAVARSPARSPEPPVVAGVERAEPAEPAEPEAGDVPGEKGDDGKVPSTGASSGEVARSTPRPVHGDPLVHAGESDSSSA